MAEVIINGPEGRIEARYHLSPKENAPIALILHPHPEHGGSMDNKVTYALYWAFANRGFNTLRFNFRGVGKSAGRFSQGEGELCDAAAVLDWLQTYNPNATNCWVAGFSFGAWIAMQLLMRRPEVDRFIAVSPPANLYDFSFLAPCPVSGLIIQGDRDEIVPKESVDDLTSKLSIQKNIEINKHIIAGADHFFTNKLETVINTADEYIWQATGQEKVQRSQNR